MPRTSIWFTVFFWKAVAVNSLSFLDVVCSEKNANHNSGLHEKDAVLPTRTTSSSTSSSRRRQLLHRFGWGASSLLGGGGGVGGLVHPPPSVAAEIASTLNVLPHLAPEYYTNVPPESREDAGRFYFPTLTPPFRNRATFRYSLGRNMWALEQLLTFGNVTATVRTTVVRLHDGESLWVHSPQYPTGEFRTLLDELGIVKHVVLPCNALEHKAPVHDFVHCYPQASVWIAPGQYGPFGNCGTSLVEPCRMGYQVDGILSIGDQRYCPNPPWVEEFEYETLYLDLPDNAGPVSEVVFVHKPSNTLIVVDALVFVPPERPPRIFETYFDTATLQSPLFWPQTVLQSVFVPLRFEPTSSDDDEDGTTLQCPGFDALQGRLLRAPILRALDDARAPDETRRWVERWTDDKRWKYDRIVTSHFASPVDLSPLTATRDIRAAFAHLDASWTIEGEGPSRRMPPLTCRDWDLLENLNRIVTEQRLGAPVVGDYRGDCIP